MTTIYLIRHGQAEGNYYRRCHSWHNGLLTSKGREQLVLLEKRFENVHIDAVYSSDLYRAMSTAGAIYRPRGLTLRVDPGLREIGAGAWEDIPWGQLLHDHREALTSFLCCDPDWYIEGGEHFPQVRERVERAVARIAAAHPGQTVAVVSHGCAIRAGLSAWLGMGVDRIGLIPLSDNTGVAKLEVENSHVQVVYYNDNSHLGAFASPARSSGRDYALSVMEAGGDSVLLILGGDGACHGAPLDDAIDCVDGILQVGDGGGLSETEANDLVLQLIAESLEPGNFGLNAHGHQTESPVAT